MKEFENKHQLLHCLNKNADATVEKRLVWMGQGSPDETPQVTAPPEQNAITDLRLFSNSVKYQDNREQLFQDLSKKDSRLALNFEQALKESLEKAGYDQDIDTFWKEMKTLYKCSKVEIRNSQLHFFNDNNVEVAPNFSSIPITPDLTRFHTDTPRTKYYNPDTGLVNLKGYRETREITVKDIVLNARDGTEIMVTAAGSKKARKATFGNNGEKAFYEDNSVVKIFDGYKVELVRPKTGNTAAVETKPDWGKFPLIGEFSYSAMWGTNEGLSAEDYINEALGLNNPSKIPTIKADDPTVKRLRELVQKGYTKDQYISFLKSHNAIKADKIYLIFDPSEENKRAQTGVTTAERTEARERATQRSTEFEGQRVKYYIPGNLDNDVKFVLRDPKMIQLVREPQKWMEAWASGNIESLKVLKGIIESEPAVFGQFSKNPDYLRLRIRDAIANGFNNTQLDFEDFIDSIMQGNRLPSYSTTRANKQTLEQMQKKDENFDHWYKRNDAEQRDNDYMKLAHGFLQKLGPETYKTATVTKVSDDSVWMNLAFEGNLYTVKATEGGSARGEKTFQIFNYGTETPYTDSAGYDNSERFKVSTVAEGENKEGNPVQTWFRDAVTPPMTYSRFMDVYKANKAEIDAAAKNPEKATNFEKQMINVVIAGNRFLLQLRNLEYVETSLGKQGADSMREDREVVIQDEKFVETLEDRDRWKKEWEKPTFNSTKRLKQLFATEPVLIALIPPEQVADRLHEAATNWSNKVIGLEDIMDYVFKKDWHDWKEEYDKYFDAQNNPKPGVPQDTIDLYRDTISACNKLLMVFKGVQESNREKSETTYVAQKLRMALDLQTTTSIDIVFYDADQLVNSGKSNAILYVRPVETVTKGAKLGLDTSVLGAENTGLVTQYKLNVFKMIFQTHSIEELLSLGCISKTPDNSFVITKLPAGLANFLLAKPDGQNTNLVMIINSNTDLTLPIYRENINENSRARKYAEMIFPNKESVGSNADVVEGTASMARTGERVYDRLSYSFVHSQFMKEITVDGTVDGQIDQKKMIDKLNAYLGLYLARLPLRYSKDTPNDIERESRFKSTLGNIPPITQESLDTIMNDWKKRDEFNKAVRDGFDSAHDEKIEKQNQEANEKLKKNYEEWKNSLTPEELSVLEKALKEAKVPEKEIPAVITKLLPLWFALGVDTVTGTVGVAVGATFPIELGQNGEYGTIYLGPQIMLGGNYKTGQVGAMAGGHLAYETPHLGPFSIIVGAAAAAGVVAGGGEFDLAVGVTGFAGINAELGTINGTKVTVTAGIGVVDGLVLPCLAATFEANHVVQIEEAITISEKAMGMDIIDSGLATAKTDQEKVIIIGNNQYIRNCIERANGGVPLEKIDPPSKVIKDYQEMKKSVVDSAREKYVPGPTVSFGFGFNKYGKFLLGFGVSILTDQEFRMVRHEGKTQELMRQQVAVSQLDSLIKNRESGKKLTQGEQTTIQQGLESGQLVVDSKGKTAIALARDEGLPPPKPFAQEGIVDVKSLQSAFNEILSTQKMYVEYDPQKQLFELKFKDWNNNTNYNIAVDPKMKAGGVMIDSGRIYLASSFKPDKALTILRGDYEYPFKDENKNYLTIVSISDSPMTPAHEIYRNASYLLSSRGGDWYQEKGPGFDQYAPQKPPFLPASEVEQFRINDQTINQGKPAMANGPNKQETQKNIDSLTYTQEEFGQTDETAAARYAIEFLSRHPIEYRQKSNAESLHNEFDALNKQILDDWKKTQKGKDEPSPAQLNLIRLKLVDESFNELGKTKDPKVRKRLFQERLNYTETYIIKPRFELLVKRNHEKYPAGDPRRIRQTGTELARIVINRAREIDVNAVTGGTPLNLIDRFSTVAGTRQVLGFRGNIGNFVTTDTNHVMLGASDDYTSFLKSKPESTEADLARLIFEENSTMPSALSDITPESDASKLLANKDKIRELFKADLSQKVLDTLKLGTIMDELFSPGVRDEIFRLAANKDNLASALTQLSARAISEFDSLVQGIRKAQTSGEQYFYPAGKPKYRFFLKQNTRDGVYKKCTNYSTWINESIRPEIIVSSPGASFDLRAGYGVSTSSTVTDIQQTATYMNIAAALAVGPAPEDEAPPVTPPPNEPEPDPAQTGTTLVEVAPDKVITVPGAESTPAPGGGKP